MCVLCFSQFQKAKLAFEEKLVAAGEAGEIGYSIVRPTAFFKSVSGQLEVKTISIVFLVSTVTVSVLLLS